MVKLMPKMKLTIGLMAEETLTMETFVSRMSRLRDSKRSTSGVSCA